VLFARYGAFSRKKDMYYFGFTQREFDTILAALRAYQGTDCILPSHVIPAIAAGEHGQPLTAHEIDSLCEYLNPADPQNYRLEDGRIEGIRQGDRHDDDR
jgi:hypothetical protein